MLTNRLYKPILVTILAIALLLLFIPIAAGADQADPNDESASSPLLAEPADSYGNQEDTMPDEGFEEDNDIELEPEPEIQEQIQSTTQPEIEKQNNENKAAVSTKEAASIADETEIIVQPSEAIEIAPAALSTVTTESELLQAIDNITATGTITIAADIALADTVSIPIGKAITLISQSPSVYSVRPTAGFAGGRLLNILGSCTVQNLVFDGSNAASGISVNGGYLYWGSGAIVRNATIVGNGAGIGVFNNGRLDIDGGEISNNTAISSGTASNGGGIYIYDSTAVLYDGQITGNTAAWGGGVTVFSQDIDSESVFTMLGGLIDENVATTEYGGGVYVNLRCTFNLGGGTISNNRARGGAGVFLGRPTLLPEERERRQACTLVMDGGIITGNIAEVYGGGIYTQWNGQVNINAGTVTGNTAQVGGGIALATATSTDYYSVSLLFTGGEVSYNTATTSVGGGIYADPSPYSNRLMQVVIGRDGDTSDGPQLHQNTASASGGGAWINNRVDVRLLSGEVYENESQRGAGGGFSISGDVDFAMSGGSVYENTAATNGGGLYLTGIARAALSNGRIAGNTAVGNGGGIYASIANTSLSALTLEDNRASNGGGAFVTLAATISAANGTRWIANTATLDGGGVFTQDFSYADPADTSRYSNIQFDNSTVFRGNVASDAYQPPSNAVFFPNLGFSRSSISTGAGWLHPLNNYDINFVSPPPLMLYSVTYDANGGNGGYTDEFVLSGADYTVLADSSTGISRGGYVFSGWNTEADGSGTLYAAGDSFTIRVNVLLFAIWELEPSAALYQVAYDANGGSGSYTDRPFSSGEIYTVLSAASAGISREGYIFSSWNTRADGFGTSYTAGETFAIQADTTLYALWQSAQFTVRYYWNDGTSAIYSTQPDVAYGSTLEATKPADPQRKGFAFTGWYIDPHGQIPWNFVNDMVVQDTSLYAGWLPTTTSTGDTGSGISTSTPGGVKTGDASPIARMIVLFAATTVSTILLFKVSRNNRQASHR